jgi:hypothetical protein
MRGTRGKYPSKGEVRANLGENVLREARGSRRWWGKGHWRAGMT